MPEIGHSVQSCTIDSDPTWKGKGIVPDLLAAPLPKMLEAGVEKLVGGSCQVIDSICDENDEQEQYEKIS